MPGWKVKRNGPVWLFPQPLTCNTKYNYGRISCLGNESALLLGWMQAQFFSQYHWHAAGLLSNSNWADGAAPSWLKVESELHQRRRRTWYGTPNVLIIKCQGTQENETHPNIQAGLRTMLSLTHCSPSGSNKVKHKINTLWYVDPSLNQPSHYLSRTWPFIYVPHGCVSLLQLALRL